MAKLGYTWYPKDWGNSEAVFELTLIERGLYRELIDMAMLNDNKTVINIKVWSRKFGSSIDEIEQILITLKDLNLIELTKDGLFIPSCEPSLKLVRGGSNGGKKSKPTEKSKENLKEALPKASTEALPKPNIKESKKKVNIKEIEIPTLSEFISYARERKPKVNQQQVSNKYESWKVNDWKDGFDKSIKNWKSKLLNTLQYLNETDSIDYVVDNNPVN